MSWNYKQAYYFIDPFIAVLALITLIAIINNWSLLSGYPEEYQHTLEVSEAYSLKTLYFIFPTEISEKNVKIELDGFEMKPTYNEERFFPQSSDRWVFTHAFARDINYGSISLNDKIIAVIDLQICEINNDRWYIELYYDEENNRLKVHSAEQERLGLL